MLTPDQWAVIRDLGFGGLLAITLVGGFRGLYVWRWQYRALETDRDFWRNLALRAVPLAEKATDVALSEKRDA